MIKVVSSMCGSGKSTKMLEKINNSSGDVRWLYITPYLDEVNDRVPAATPDISWKTPVNRGNKKLGDILKLVKRGEDIVSTHSLMQSFTQEIVDAIIHMDYTLVIDEAIECIGQLGKGVCNVSDVKALLVGEFVFIQEDSSVVWNEEKYPEHDGKYSDIRSMCDLGVLHGFRDSFIMWQYPSSLLSEIKECYVLTYMFEGSTMSAWLTMKGIPYEYVNHEEFGLKDEEEIKQVIRDNLTLVDSRALTAFYKNQTFYTLSSKWYRTAKAPKIKVIKGMIRSAVVTNKLRQGDIFWTCYKDAYEKLKGSGYTKGASDKGLAFIPFNIKATNNFKDHKYCVYGINLFKNPTEVAYMESLGVSVESDMWVVSEMVQFIFRGCIREGKPMELMILSRRMRKLLENWLYE